MAFFEGLYPHGLLKSVYQSQSFYVQQYVAGEGVASESHRSLQYFLYDDLNIDVNDDNDDVNTFLQNLFVAAFCLLTM